MRRLLRTLLPAVFLAVLQAPLALGQMEQPELYAYHDLIQYGGVVFAFVGTDIAYPPYFNHCDFGCNNNCWDAYTSYAETDLYWDGFWVGGDSGALWDTGVSAYMQVDAWPGVWTLEATHHVEDLYYRDAYGFQWHEPWMPDHQWEDLTVNPNPEISISGSQHVDDGGTGYFNVTVQYGVPTGYQWSFENSSPAGNAPDVTFSPPTDTPTLTDAHWYAYPDSVCSAGGTATYPREATVGFDSGSLSEWTWLWVNGWWDPTGFTGAPNLPIDLVPYFSNGLWRVHTNTQVQKVYSFSMIWVPGSSQFWYKTFVHEQEHVRQWAPGGTVGYLYSPAELRARLLDLSAETQAGLQQLVQQTADAYMWEQAQASLDLKPQSEREAYAISDLYAPWYIYEGQCKGY